MATDPARPSGSSPLPPDRPTTPTVMDTAASPPTLTRQKRTLDSPPSDSPVPKLSRAASDGSISSIGTDTGTTTRMHSPARSEATSPAPQAPNHRCPPIMLDAPRAWSRHATNMSQLVGGNLSVSCNGRTMKITTRTPHHFRAVQKYLVEEGLPFHTFSLPQERPLTVLIKGLPMTIEAEEIVGALWLQGFKAEAAKPLRRDGGRNTGLWRVTLTPQGKDGCKRMSDVYNVTSILYLRVQVFKMDKSSGPIQCHRCQGFGHSSPNCSRPQRCVRCGGPHQSSGCQKQPGERGACCNCGGTHNANYRGCEAFKNEKLRQAGRGITKRPAGRAPPAIKPAARPTQLAAYLDAPSVDQERAMGKLATAGDDDANGPTEEPGTYAEVVRRRRRRPREPENRRPAPSNQNACPAVAAAPTAPIPAPPTCHALAAALTAAPTAPASAPHTGHALATATIAAPTASPPTPPPLTPWLLPPLTSWKQRPPRPLPGHAPPVLPRGFGKTSGPPSTHPPLLTDPPPPDCNRPVPPSPSLPGTQRTRICHFLPPCQT